MLVSPEEAKAEQEALAEKKEEEIRANIISEFGFNEDDDAEKIDKLVEKETSHYKNLSQAIGQKIKYREALKNPPKSPENPPKEPVKPVVPDEDFQKKVADTVNQTLEQRDLESLEYPDELKSTIADLAKLKKVSVKKVLSEPYVQFKIEEHKKAQKTEEATIGRTTKTGTAQTYNPDVPPDVDISTPEGVKVYDEWFEKARKEGKYQPNI